MKYFLAEWEWFFRSNDRFSGEELGDGRRRDFFRVAESIEGIYVVPQKSVRTMYGAPLSYNTATVTQRGFHCTTLVSGRHAVVWPILRQIYWCFW